MYQVKEIFYSLQGEGARSGRPSVFCRFSGCNLWTGREDDRKDALCYFCDTDFVGTNGPGGGKFASAADCANAIASTWPSSGTQKLDRKPPYVVFTGGEPLLQLDSLLIQEMKERGFEVAVETNGTIDVPDGIDWITVSPKPNAPLVQLSGNELKLVFPHEVRPEDVQHLEFKHFYLMPLATSDERKNYQYTEQALHYCLAHPQWSLTLQTHKQLGIR